MNATTLLILAYFVLLAGLSAGALPYRRRMRKLGAELCALPLNDTERGVVEGMLRHAYSWRMAIVLFLVFVAGLFQAGDVLDRDSEQAFFKAPNFTKDDRFHQFCDAFFASVIGVNPIFGMLAVAAKVAFRVKALRYHSSNSARQMTDIRAAMTV